MQSIAEFGINTNEVEMHTPKGAFRDITSLCAYVAESVAKTRQPIVPFWAVVTDDKEVVSEEVDLPFPLVNVNYNPEEVECYVGPRRLKLNLSRYNIFPVDHQPMTKDFLFADKAEAARYAAELREKIMQQNIGS